MSIIVLVSFDYYGYGYLNGILGGDKDVHLWLEEELHSVGTSLEELGFTTFEGDPGTIALMRVIPDTRRFYTQDGPDDMMEWKVEEIHPLEVK